MAPPAPAPTGVGTLNEHHLHAALKAWYARPGDRAEQRVDGFVIDLVRSGLLIEIQTGGFSAMSRKLTRLTRNHPVRLVYPVARERWIVKPAGDGSLTRRKSPKRGVPADVFAELVSIPRMLRRERFEIELLMIREEQVRRTVLRRRGRGWAIVERRLLGVDEVIPLATPSQLATLLPAGLTEPFTTAHLASGLGRPRRLAQQMAYCLRECGIIEQVGKEGNALLYSRSDAPAQPAGTDGKT